MTPTTFTVVSTEAATEKKTAEPPSASAVSPKGVWIESSATEPTTRSDTLHPIGSGETEEGEPVGQHLPGGPGEDEAGALDGRRLADDPTVMVPRVHDPRQFFEVAGDPVRLEGPRRAGDHVGIRRELLEELLVLWRREALHRGLGGIGGPDLAPRDPEEPREPGVRHLHVEDRVLVGLAPRQVDVEREG